MNEVAGDGALLCDPLDSNAIRGCIERVTSDAHLRRALFKKELPTASDFSPKNPLA